MMQTKYKPLKVNSLFELKILFERGTLYFKEDNVRWKAVENEYRLANMWRTGARFYEKQEKLLTRAEQLQDFLFEKGIDIGVGGGMISTSTDVFTEGEFVALAKKVIEILEPKNSREDVVLCEED